MDIVVIQVKSGRWKEEQRWWHQSWVELHEGIANQEGSQREIRAKQRRCHQSQVDLLKGFGINVISNQVESKRERRAEQRRWHQSRFKDLAFGIAMVAAESE